MKTTAQIVFCNKNTNSANDLQTTHKMSEKYTDATEKIVKIIFINYIIIVFFGEFSH